MTYATLTAEQRAQISGKFAALNGMCYDALQASAIVAAEVLPSKTENGRANNWAAALAVLALNGSIVVAVKGGKNE